MKEEMLFTSTRSECSPIRASQAILKGLADDGGLFVPLRVPSLDRTPAELAAMDYRGVAFEVMKLWLTDFTDEELRHCIDSAYDSKFDRPLIAPLRRTKDAFYLELFHGATIAFKDMALSILPHLMITSAAKNGVEDEIVILTATSGDTGKAALAGFADVKGTKIIVFYPKDGVSSIQERQMVTQKGDNTCVIGIRGNFDDAQTGVKKIFTDPSLRSRLAERGFRFSSANSINIGRLVPQIVYYVYAYTRLLGQGEITDGQRVNFVVPTGNFGNILAAYYAGRMGLPIGKLVCASNSNKVLFDFLETGTYDRNRPFILTSSPSMDILISSNLERLLYHACGDDPSEVSLLMQELSSKGTYTLPESMREGLKGFCGGYATEEETFAEIRKLYETEGYVIDPHTAVASAVYRKYRDESGDTAPAVIASTASPFKFESAVMRALGQPLREDDLEMAEDLSRIAGVEVPEAVAGLRGAKIMHQTVCRIEEMESEVLRFLEKRS